MCPITWSKRKNPVWYKRVQDYKLRRKLFIQLERGPALYIYPYLDMLFPWCIRNDKYLAINSTSKLKLDTWIFLWICLISKTKFVFEIILIIHNHKAQYAERQNSVLFHLYMWPRYSCLLTEIWGGHTDRHTRYYTYTSIYIILHANNVYMHVYRLRA